MKNIMKPTRLNKAYINFKQELFRELLKARLEYKKNKTGVNYEKVVDISDILESINLMKDNINKIG